MTTVIVKHVLVIVAILSRLLYQHAQAEDVQFYDQFYGGSMSYQMEKQVNGTDLVTIELITGWVLGKGPCGPSCNISDIGRSTRSTRPLMMNVAYYFGNYLGSYTYDFRNKTTSKTEHRDMNALVRSTYNETVIAVSEMEKLEQELLHFSFIMPPGIQKLDVNFDGYSWRKLTLQGGNGRWHIQTTVSTALRSDTGKPNLSPRSFAKPFYRIELGTIAEIHILAVDDDGDFIICMIAEYIEGGYISQHPPPNVQVFQNCTVSINTSSSNYTNDSWIAVPVEVRDYNRKKITYGENEYMPATFSLSATSVQFTVQVIANLITPEFVEPTFESDHLFIMYADTTLRTKIYAEAPENTTLESFTALGIQHEQFKLSSIQQDLRRPQVKYATMTWKPSAGEIGPHIACVNARDNTGVDSAEEICFILDVKGDVFNHTTKDFAGKPYFVDIPSPDQYVNCKIHSTCVVPLYVKSTTEVVDVRVTESYIDQYQLGPIQIVTHKGETVFQTDLSFEHSLHGEEHICFIAKNKNGVESENVCIQSKIEPPNPCISAPCLNSATCVRETDTGGFTCRCLSGFSGKTCQIKEDKCKPDPCVRENTQICAGIGGILCYCKQGFAGDTCDKNIDDCHANACNGHGSCKDRVNGFDCECFSRYNGTRCENDTCSAQSAGIKSCPADGCSPNPCQGGGVCLQGGTCSCSSGFSGNSCETRRCSISGAVTEVKIISPSVNDGSKIICYTQGDTISSCKTRIYLAVSSGSNPNIDVETTSELKNSISVGPVTKSSVLPGVSTMYSTDVTINGTLNSTKLQYLCVHASVGTSTSSVCYELSFVLNPESDSTTLAFLQRNATVKFVQPTVKDRSRILCKAGEKCYVLMYTSFASSRHSCSGPSTNSSGSFTGCDKDDKDNDEDDPDRSAKATDPCCENVVSSSADVTVYQAHPRGPSCVTETAFKFASAGEKDICFHSASAKTDFQQICYKVGVYDSTSDPCSSSPCLNNGHCFHVDHNNFKCICADNYTGDKCEKGPCQPADNRCHNGAYCQTNYGVATCICRAGYSGQTCNIDPSSLHESSAGFTDTAEPLVFPCVIRQTCSIALLLTGPSGHIPMVSPGYIDLSILLEEIKTVDRKPVQNSYQTDIKIKPLELGVKDMCIQTMNITGVNTDELCFKVNVIFDVISIYGFKDRPHFIEPSMPTNTEVECMAEGPCHVLYHVTPGIGNENECVTFIPHPPDGFVNYHLFSSCDNCKPGNSSNGNCTVDVSIVNSNIGTVRHFCLSVGLKGSSVGGERRCFNIIVKDPSTVGKVGCQILSCANGGFCDSHDPSRPVCFCPKGFSGTNCEKAEVLSPMTNAQTQTFIGDLALPTKLKCVVNKSCSIPFQVVSKPGITPTVSLGYNDLRLVEAPSLKALGNSSTVFEGYTVATPTTAGNFKLCLQANLNSKTEDEMCVMIEVTRKAIAMTDQTKPYFLSPTITTDSTVLCVVNKACHIDMHVTAGDNFGFVGRCPALTETSRIPVQGVHIFYGIRQAAECITDVSYIPPAADGEHVLCLQVALPGKKGEERCYTINVVNDTQEEVISPCRGVTCEHGGKCLVDFGSTPPRAYCLCTSGFTGNDCKLDIDDCRPNPCQNGATCVDQVNNYTCTCNRGYIGRDCEIDIGDCVPNPCKNGATCVDEGNNYTCICYPGHIGRHCEVVLDPCISNPCLRGTCFHHAPKYHCVCPAGYTGKKCEISISECQSQPCLNGGVCVDNIGNFTCNCSNGFVGKLCENDVNECISQPCLNGGLCKDGINQFLCQCRAGFDGDRCQNGNDPCMSNPCVRGICFSHEYQFLCECPKGFTGELCETIIQLTMNGPKETYLKVPVGSELTLNCSMSGQHTLYWSKLNGCDLNSKYIKASVYRQPHASIGDSGTYICAGSNGSGPNITRYFNVDITALHKEEVCDFDDGTLCDWEQQKNDNFDWTFQNGPTQSVGTGPDVDHTLGTVQGIYIYVESSSPRKFGEQASILSHVLPSNRTMCFEFWYYMFGDGSGTLFVFLQDTCTKMETQVFKEAGDKGAQWNKASVTIASDSVPNDYRIVLMADVGTTYHGDTALDDLIIRDGQCQGSHGAPIVG